MGSADWIQPRKETVSPTSVNRNSPNRKAKRIKNFKILEYARTVAQLQYSRGRRKRKAWNKYLKKHLLRIFQN